MADPHAIANDRGMVSATARRARMDDGLLTDRRTAPLVADAGSARTPTLRPGPGLREDVDHGGAAGALLPLLRVRPRGGDGLLLLRESAYGGVCGGKPP